MNASDEVVLSLVADLLGPDDPEGPQALDDSTRWLYGRVAIGTGSREEAIDAAQDMLRELGRFIAGYPPDEGWVADVVEVVDGVEVHIPQMDGPTWRRLVAEQIADRLLGPASPA